LRLTLHTHLPRFALDTSYTSAKVCTWHFIHICQGLHLTLHTHLPRFTLDTSYTSAKVCAWHFIHICQGLHLTLHTHLLMFEFTPPHICQCFQFTSHTHLLKLLDSQGFAVIVSGWFWFWFVWVQNASWFYMKLWISGCLTMTAKAQRFFQTPVNPHPSATHNIPEYLNLYQLIWEPEILHPQIELIGSQKQFTLWSVPVRKYFLSHSVCMRLRLSLPSLYMYDIGVGGSYKYNQDVIKYFAILCLC
jgi:hypothetical protein